MRTLYVLFCVFIRVPSNGQLIGFRPILKSVPNIYEMHHKSVSVHNKRISNSPFVCAVFALESLNYWSGPQGPTDQYIRKTVKSSLYS